MKKLQNNFTTTEQSKRLLDLGLPEWTADCFYKLDLYSFKTEMCFTKEDSLLHHYTPCWSVGRLIEIYLLCAELKKPQMIFIKEDVLMMDRMINELCCMAESERLDFSKLEE